MPTPPARAVAWPRSPSRPGSRAVACGMAPSDRCRVRRPRPHTAPVGQRAGAAGGHGAEGVLGDGRHLPGESLLYGFYNRFGESLPSIGLARAAARYMRGRPSDATRRAGKRAVEPLVDLVQPWALEALQAHRAEGLRIVLATTSPLDLVAAAGRCPGLRRRHRHPVRGARRPVHRAARRRLRLGTGQAGGRGPVGRRPRRRPRGVARLHRQRLRPAAAAGGRASPSPQRRSPAGGRGPGPALAARALGPPARDPLGGRLRALPPHSPVLPARGLPLRPLRHQRLGAHPDPRAGAPGLQPPQLLRRRRPRHRGRTIGAPGALPGQAGGVRLPRSWAASPEPSAASPSNGEPARRSPMRRAAAALRAGEVVIVLPQGTIPRGRRSSIRCSGVTPGRPAWPPRPVPRSSPSACGGPSGSGRDRPGCPT